MFQKISIFAFLLFYSLGSSAQVDSIHNASTSNLASDSTVIFNKPTTLGFVGHVPADLWGITKSPFQKGSFKNLSIVVGSSLLLYWQDK